MSKRPTVSRPARKLASAARRVTHLGTPPDQIEQLKKSLPYFQPINLRSLVLAAKKRSGPDSLDERIPFVLRDRLKEDTEQLLRGLGFDPDDCDWKSAFMRLARIHHGLGRLVHTPNRTNSNAQKFTEEDDLRLLRILGDLKAEDIEGPAAFETIARRPELRKQFLAYATRSQIKGKDKLAKSLSERARKFQLRNRALFERRLLAAFAGRPSMDAGEIETLLRWLDTQASVDAAKIEND